MERSFDITMYLRPGFLSEDRAVEYAVQLNRYMEGAACSFRGARSQARLITDSSPIRFLDRIDVIGQAPDVVSAVRNARDALASTLREEYDKLPITTVIVNVLNGSDDPLAIELEAA